MSVLQKTVQEYLTIRRAFGYKLEREGGWLPDFITFLERHGGEFITSELALAWATQSAKASQNSKAKRLTMVRGLAKYVRANDPRTQIPAIDILPRKNNRYTPHIYSTEEIKNLLSICSCLKGSLVPYTYKTLIGLLAVTGMRLGEAINLNCSDIDIHERIITIRKAKFGKSRELPVHSSTIKALQSYALKRDCFFRRPKSPSFFVSKSGQRLLTQNVWRKFDRIRALADLDKAGQPTPRIHDFRHTFAVQTLMLWYRKKSDVESNLSLLSTYLGHVSPASTYLYLTGTPELLALAVNKLEKSLGTLK